MRNSDLKPEVTVVVLPAHIPEEILTAMMMKDVTLLPLGWKFDGFITGWEYVTKGTHEFTHLHVTIVGDSLCRYLNPTN